MMNGPVEGLGEGSGPPLRGERPWDRAWTLDEMQKGASHWSLASDAGMLHYLQEFSQKMISRTHDIQEQMNALIHEAKLTGVRLDNTVNDFIMLANTQFVENRVYEENISQDEASSGDSKKKKQELTREERSAALIRRIKDAMAFGLEALDAAFEKIDVNETNSESDDDDTAYVTEAILEPKDPYLGRPLPHLIGTPAFLQSDDIGLVEETSDDDVSDHGSISESESAASSSGDEAQKVNGDAGRDRHAGRNRHVSTSSSSEVESESSGDLFGCKESDADEDKELKDGGKTDVIETQQTKADDFASELASRIRSSPPPMNKESKTKKRSSNKDDLFAASSLGSDEDVDDDSPFSRKSGLFSSGGGLFDDNQEEDGLFADGPSAEEKTTGGSLGQDRNVGKREDTPEGKREGKKERVKATVKKPPAGGLFDDDQDDNLFAALAPKKPSVKPAEPTAPAKSGLFGEDDDEEDAIFAVKEQKAASSKKKLPAGAVSMFGGAQNPLVAAIKAQKSPRSDTDEDQTWSDEGNQSSVSSVSTTSATRARQRKDQSPSASSNSLFAEEPEDLFSGSMGKTTARGGGTGGALASGTGGAGGGGLFSDDEDLFGSTSKPQVATPIGSRARKSGLLFDAEDDDGGDFLSGAEVKSSITAGKRPEGGRRERESDLFGSTRTTDPKQPPEEVRGQPPVTQRKATLSLFDDDDDDDLFGVTTSLATSSTGQESLDAQTRASTKTHFQHEDWLFGGGDDNDPSVDLFRPKKSPKTEVIQNKVTPRVATEGTTSKSSDEGDIVPSVAEAKKAVQEDETDVIPVKPKKLAGAVSMFGGIDPAKVGRPRSTSRPPITEKPKQPEDNFVDQTDKQFTKSSSEGATIKPGASSLPAVKSDLEPPVGKSRTSPDIRTKQANLSLDPSALLPGASGPRKRVEAGRAVEGAASFDEPTQTPVLHSISKDRARVQMKRRPPSRKSRLTMNNDSNSQDVPDTTEVIDREVDPGHGPYTPPTDDSLFSPRKDNKLTTSKKTQKRDLFSDDSGDLLAAAENMITGNSEIPGGGLSDRDDVVTGPSVVTTRRSTSKTKATEDLFGDNDTIHPQGSKVGHSERSHTDQLPQSIGTEIAAKHSSSSDDELFPSSNRGGATKSTIRQTSDLFVDNDDVDDIFGVDKKAPVGSSLPEKDNIFGSGFTNASKSQALRNDSLRPMSKPANVSAVAPPDDNEIDDIFADSTVNVKKGRKSPDRKVTHRKPPSDDEDDIFGATSRPVHHQPRKAITKDKDIFADDTDIFADLPSSKPRSKKMKAKTSTGQTKSLFSSDDVDDIFADVLSKPKPRVKKSLTPAKAAATPKGASVFDDDSPSIFDDPLNALGK